MRYWLMKSEPGEFSIDDLARRPGGREPWDGIRNYQARNMLRDEMKVGDLAFFYHSSCAEPGIAGIMRVAREAYPDETAFNPRHKHYDPKSDPANPRWYVVDVEFVRRLRRQLSLAELKQHAPLANLPVLRRGNRLSVTPVSPEEWQYILDLEG